MTNATDTRMAQLTPSHRIALLEAVLQDMRLAWHDAENEYAQETIALQGKALSRLIIAIKTGKRP